MVTALPWILYSSLMKIECHLFTAFVFCSVLPSMILHYLFYLLFPSDLQQGVSPSEALLVLPDTKKGLSGAILDENGLVVRQKSILSDIPSWSTEREEVRESLYVLSATISFFLYFFFLFLTPRL